MLIENDSVVVFSAPQARKLDSYRIELKHSKKLNVELKSRVFEAENVMKAQSTLISDLKNENSIMSDIQSKQDELILQYDKRVLRLEKKSKRLGNTAKIFGVGFVVSLGGFVYLLNK